MFIVGAIEFGGSWHDGGQATQILRDGSARWNDARWRAATRATLAALGVELPRSQLREVTELNHAFLTMDEELRASLRQQAALEEERRMFVSAIAHDLRTPLFSLRGHLEGLEHGIAATPHKIAQYVRV